ncbi:Palmitoyl protein thioesterase [Arabidopsis suecica]|uniref:Alpha/beta-Hydrolases superfamily protein n=2 Tax=Arabidopsis TaxID=3701 RepID=F4JX42_ARATH|nr:alpha/beta-Hydrolases superfamily protein [Arabidopsis thaliana]AED95500.1 alpha/beta-Hydrolases superfamily protein [Arabidopsis thaliana]KAG7611844.1 Palmitoyl protein thioesterase [Arabidopsis suecica]|eukprot:NP_199545.2 alpha/beta-Hydrolases superfamily protein [Arabidopsis thaliana]
MEKGLKRSCVMVVVAFLAKVDISVSVPFIMLHGIASQCSDDTNANFTQLLTNLSGSPGFCLEIGNGVINSMFLPLTQQAEIACENVKEMKELSQGYNIVGRSQGNLVARGLIEFCDGGPPVFNYISLAGPHAGISSLPRGLCGLTSDPACKKFNELIKGALYSETIQDHLAPSGYYKIPNDMKQYLERSKYLPKLNNEIPNQRNQTYKDRFTSLHNLVLVKFQDDEVITPNDSTWFGFYPDGEFETLLSANQTKLYTEDWIGLKTLDDAGKVKFVSVPGGHVRMAEEDVVKYVVPYLQNQQPAAQSFNRKTKEPLHP